MDGRRDPAGIRGSVVHNRFANGGWESLLRPDGMGYRPCLLDLDGRGEVDRNEMDSTYRYVTSGRSMLTAIDRIKTCPGVEAVGAG